MAFLKGAFWGVVIGGTGAAVVSVVTPQPAGLTPPLPPVTVLQDVPQNQGPMTIDPPDLPVVASDDAPAVAVPVATLGTPDVAADVPQADGDTAQPQAMDLVVIAPATPQVPAAPLAARPAADVPVLPNPQSMAPQVPAAESDIIVDAVPSTVVEVMTPAPNRDQALQPRSDPQDTEVVVIGIIDPAALAQVDATTQTPETGADFADRSAALVTLPDDNDAIAPATGDAATVTSEQVVNPAADPAAEAATSDATPSVTFDLPAVVAIIDAPSRGLPGGDTSVVIRRPGAAAPVTAAASVPEAAPIVDDAMPALVRYGAFFDNADGKPLMSIVLIDDGRMTDGARALADVPFPVTVLLNPGQAGATKRMDTYATAGIEVAAMAAIPVGATATDAAVALEGTFDALPRAVALVATDAKGWPSGADVLRQVVTLLASGGRGLLVPDTGLNSSLRAAAAADVHATTIYRDLDDIDQDARVIRRFVDQAAFRARQQPGVVLLGRVRPETVSALILWGQANRAGQVALAPLSATLLAQ